jgi:hypothetical protein
MHRNSAIWQHPTIAAILESKASRNKTILNLYLASKALTPDVIASYFAMKERTVLRIINEEKMMMRDGFTQKKEAA